MAKRKWGKKSEPKRAVIFDFDGTIADSFEYVFGYLKKEAKNTKNYTVIEKHALRHMSMKRLALHLGVSPWRLATVYFRGRRYMRTHMEYVQSFAGMSDAIRKLHADGFKLYIVSANSKHNIQLFIKREGLGGCFSAVRGSSGYGGKSNLIRTLMVRHRLHKDNTCYVGDETGDVVAAARAGIPCLGVTWGFADPDKLRQVGPDAIAKRPEDIPKIVKAAWKK